MGLREASRRRGAGVVLLQTPTPSSSEDRQTGAGRQVERMEWQAATWGPGGRGGGLPGGPAAEAMPIWLRVASSSRSVSSRLSIRWVMAAR